MISIPLAIVLFIVSTILVIKLTKRKNPVWAYKTTRIIGLGTNAPPELQLTFSGSPVNDVYQTTFTLFNKGTEAIREGDVTEHVTIHFKGTTILRGPTIKATSKDAIVFSAKQVVKEGDNSIELGFLYLDHNDGAVVEVIHTAPQEISCTANIIGARQIRNIGDFRQSRPRLLGTKIVVYSVAIIGLIFFAIYVPLVLKEETFVTAIIAAFAVFTSFAFIPEVYDLLRYRRFPWWTRSTVTEGATIEEAIQAYCVKCRTKRQIKNPHFIAMKSGRLAIQGTCPNCGTKMFRIQPG